MTRCYLRQGHADLRALANLLPGSGFLFGEEPTSTDAGIFGFIANIFFYEIDTPLREFLVFQSNVVLHCQSIMRLSRNEDVTINRAAWSVAQRSGRRSR